VLEEEVRGLARLDREVLLDLFAFLATERRIGQDNVVAVLLLNVGEVLRQRVGVQDIVDVLERLLEQRCPCLSSTHVAQASRPTVCLLFSIRGARA